ncbi:unnamed protein product, partial [Mesorhabditis belari]|uniref:G protein-coupled receptor n=1 Tax=Mesorhabditis belari TaxID=2138241 RepID=A0AAF3FBD7_9BILA
MHLILTLPITITGVDFYNGTPFYLLYRSAVAYEYVSFKASMLLVFFGTLNGVSVFIFPRLNIKLFSGNSLKIIIITIWMDAIGETCIETFTDCNKAFRAHSLSFSYECTPAQAASFQFHNFDTFQRLIYPIAILIGNIFLFVYVRYVRRIGATAKGSLLRRSGGEMVLLVQGILICVFTGGNGLLFFVFNFLPSLISIDPTSVVFPLLLMVTTMGLAIAQPLLNLCFNEPIQAAALRILARKFPLKKTQRVKSLSTNALTLKPM